MNETIKYLVKASLIGASIAALIVFLFPDLLRLPDPPATDSTRVHAPLDHTESRQTERRVLREEERPALDGPVAYAPVSYAPGVARAAPAVVNIMTSRILETPLPDLSRQREADPEGTVDVSPRQLPDFRQRQEREQASLGSGVILTRDGHILTNHHVIAEAEAIAVVLADGQAMPASIIGVDTETDLAVLRIAAPDIQPAPVGRSANLAVGDVVLAIGNPFGVGQTVTQGIVSATGRNELGINVFEDFIQTDAAINPGNSGGALINALGELVGINTAIFTRSGGSHGIGFAIPIDLAVEVLHEIIERGYVARGWLGIEVQPLDRTLAQNYGWTEPGGVLIAGILNDGPADRAGLRPGDVLTHLEGQRIRSTREALNIIARKRPGEPIAIGAFREGKTVELEAVVDLRPVG